MIFDANTNDAAILKKSLGVFITYGYGQALPELKTQIMALHADRVAKLNFVPSDWLSQIQSLQAANPNDLVRLAPSEFANGNIINGNADFTISSPAVADAWQAVYMAEQKAIVAYGAKLANEGKAELDRVYADSAFWNKAYTSLESLVNLPNTFLEKFTGNISLATKVLAGVAALVVVVIAWKYANK